MNQQFEALPFGLEGEMAYERGARPMARSRAAGRSAGGGGSGKLVPARQPATGRGAARAGRIVPPRSGPARGGPFVPPRWPPSGGRPRPGWPHYYGPRYGGLWPYAAVTLLPPEPDGWSHSAPPPDAVPDFDDGSGYPPVEAAEVPPTVAATIARLPAAQRPAYVALGPLTAALRDPRATGAGFYLIEFTVNGVRRAYSGQTGNLRRRLQQHALCGQMMGLPLAAHSVYVAQSSLPETQRRAVEYRIHDDMFRTSAGVLTNQRRELEAELFGHEWR